MPFTYGRIYFERYGEKQGIENEFVIKSSATSTEEIYGDVGNPIYPPAKVELKKHGIIAADEKRAVQLIKNDYRNYDMFIAMDDKNIRNMLNIFGGDAENKIYKLMQFAGSNADVADPWYTGNFEVTYKDIFNGCEALLDKIKNC